MVATLHDELAATGQSPVHGTHTCAASGLAGNLTDIHTLADLGHVGVGVDGIDIVPTKNPAGTDLNTDQTEFNTHLSAIRAAIERAVAHLKIPGAYSAKKAAATDRQSTNTKACSAPSPA